MYLKGRETIILAPRPAVLFCRDPRSSLPYVPRPGLAARSASRTGLFRHLVHRGCIKDSLCTGKSRMGNLAVIHDEHQHRLDTKLKRELGDQVLGLLNDDRTEDILLNPDGPSGSSAWVKVSPGRRNSGGAGVECPQHHSGLARNRPESRTPHPRNRTADRREPL